MVRPTAVLIAAMTFASTLATRALAGTDESTFNKLITKYAVDITNGAPAPLKPKVACVCTLPSAPGFLVLVSGNQGNQVFCALPTFDENGKFLTAAATCSQFQVLAR